MRSHDGGDLGSGHDPAADQQFGQRKDGGAVGLDEPQAHPHQALQVSLDAPGDTRDPGERRVERPAPDDRSPAQGDRRAGRGAAADRNAAEADRGTAARALLKLFLRAGQADRDGRLLRQARLLTEAGRVQERLRIAGRLQVQLGRIQDRRLDLLPELPAAYLLARDAMRRAEGALRQASVTAKKAVPPAVEVLRPPLLDRLKRRISSRPPPAAAPDADQVEAARAARRNARETAERELAEARHVVARIVEEHNSQVVMTETERMTGLALLARRTALMESALVLLAEDEDWAVLGQLALMRAARQAMQHTKSVEISAEEASPEFTPCAAPGVR